MLYTWYTCLSVQILFNEKFGYHWDGFGCEMRLGETVEFTLLKCVSDNLLK